MKLFILSIRLFTLGAICDFSAALCTKTAESAIRKNKPLTKKLLTKMSNFSNTSFVKWQKIEQRFIHLSIEKTQPWLQQPR